MLKLVFLNTTVGDKKVLGYELNQPFKSFWSIKNSSGVENLNGSEHFSHIQIKGLNSIEKVLEQYDKLISDNLANINVEPLSYNL